MEWLFMTAAMFWFAGCAVGWFVIGVLAGQDCVDEARWREPVLAVWCVVAGIIAFAMVFLL